MGGDSAEHPQGGTWWGLSALQASELQPPCRQLCTPQAPGPATPAREPGLCQAGGSVPRWEGGEARKHRVLRAGRRVITLKPDAWKQQGQPPSSGRATGRKVITVRKQALDAGRGFNPVHIPGGWAQPARPRHAPHGAQPGRSFTLFSDVAALRVFFQQTCLACCVCLIINEWPSSSAPIASGALETELFPALGPVSGTGSKDSLGKARCPPAWSPPPHCQPLGPRPLAPLLALRSPREGQLPPNNDPSSGRLFRPPGLAGDGLLRVARTFLLFGRHQAQVRPWEWPSFGGPLFQVSAHTPSQ